MGLGWVGVQSILLINTMEKYTAAAARARAKSRPVRTLHHPLLPLLLPLVVVVVLVVLVIPPPMVATIS